MYIQSNLVRVCSQRLSGHSGTLRLVIVVVCIAIVVCLNMIVID
jgi:hypothetical protein